MGRVGLNVIERVLERVADVFAGVACFVGLAGHLDALAALSIELVLVE